MALKSPRLKIGQGGENTKDNPARPFGRGPEGEGNHRPGEGPRWGPCEGKENGKYKVTPPGIPPAGDRPTALDQRDDDGTETDRRHREELAPPKTYFSLTLHFPGTLDGEKVYLCYCRESKTTSRKSRPPGVHQRPGPKHTGAES